MLLLVPALHQPPACLPACAPAAGYEGAQPRLIKTLERLTVHRATEVPPEYLYYGIPTPWLQVRGRCSCLPPCMHARAACPPAPALPLPLPVRKLSCARAGGKRGAVGPSVWPLALAARTSLRSPPRPAC